MPLPLLVFVAESVVTLPIVVNERPPSALYCSVEGEQSVFFGGVMRLLFALVENGLEFFFNDPDGCINQCFGVIVSFRFYVADFDTTWFCRCWMCEHSP